MRAAEVKNKRMSADKRAGEARKTKKKRNKTSPKWKMQANVDKKNDIKQ